VKKKGTFKKYKMTRFNEMMKYGLDIDRDLTPIEQHEFKIEVSDDFVGYFMGFGGEKIKKMRKEYNCEIKVTRGERRFIKVNSKNLRVIGRIFNEMYIHERR
jgi:hypothetical protein